VKLTMTINTHDGSIVPRNYFLWCSHKSILGFDLSNALHVGMEKTCNHQLL